MKDIKTKKQWEFDDTANENKSQQNEMYNQDPFSAESWFVENIDNKEPVVEEKQSWEDYIVTEDEVTTPIVINIKDNQSTVKNSENEDASATAKLPKNNKPINKKPLVISLCAIVVVLSIVLGVIFIPDWNDDIPIDTNIPVEEQVNDGYISADDETDFSEEYVENISGEDLITLDEESDDSSTDEGTTNKNPLKETTAKNNSTSNNERPTLPNVIGMTEQQAIIVLNDFIKENNLITDSPPVEVYKWYRSDTEKGIVFDCNYSAPEGADYYDNISIHVSMGDGDKAWSPWSETIDVPNGYTALGYGSPYEYYTSLNNDDTIEVETSGPHERKRIVYRDRNNNNVKTEAWSEWEKSDCWYPFDEGEEYIGYDESTGYTKYYETQKNKVFYRWRYCQTYH